MSDRRTLLFALPEFRGLEVTLEPDGGRRVLVESVADQGGCPGCGVLSGLIKDRPVSRVKDLPHGPVPLVVWVRKRRFARVELLCPRRSFTETSAQLPIRARVTTRLQVKVSAAVTTTNRAMSEVATDYGIAWWTVHRILVKAVADVLGQATPTSKIGIDETRARSVRWLQQEAENKLTWRRSDPWMTSIVDLDRSHLGGIIDLAAGRSGACVQGWIALQSRQFHAAVQVVAIGPSAPYAAALRRALPPRADRAGPLPPRDAGQPDGHRRATTGAARAARTPRDEGRPGLGPPPAPAARGRPARPKGPEPAQDRARERSAQHAAPAAPTTPQQREPVAQQKPTDRPRKAPACGGSRSTDRSSLPQLRPRSASRAVRDLNSYRWQTNCRGNSGRRAFGHRASGWVGQPSGQCSALEFG